MQALIVDAVGSSGAEREAGLLFDVLAELDPGDGLDRAVGGESGVARETEAEGVELGGGVSGLCSDMDGKGVVDGA